MVGEAAGWAGWVAAGSGVFRWALVEAGPAAWVAAGSAAWVVAGWAARWAVWRRVGRDAFVGLGPAALVVGGWQVDSCRAAGKCGGSTGGSDRQNSRRRTDESWARVFFELARQ